MAKHEIVMPQMGESITNGTITKWNKKVGEQVELDEIILEISTDKVESEIPSPFSGRIAQILFEEGQVVDVGVTIALIEDDPNATLEQGSTAKPSETTATPETTAPSTTTAPISETTPSLSSQSASTSQAPSTSGKPSKRFYTPLVRAMAKKAGVDLSELEQIKGSGAGGRVNKKDFEKFLSSGGQTPSSSSVPPTQTTISAPTVSDDSRMQVIAMDNMRKSIAKNMVLSKQTSPHVHSVGEADMTHLVKFRQNFKTEFQKQEGFNLTYTHFILYALIQTLKDYPLVNASIEGDNIVVKKDINLGCAVAVPDSGLVVPVIKGADGMNITGIARAVNILATKARQKKLTLDEISGGTFTFSNVGSFGTLLATPIILQPQVGILAAGVIQKRVVVSPDDSLAVRSMMYATHTYDHRLIDGEMGGKFLASFISHLETLEPKSLF